MNKTNNEIFGWFGPSHQQVYTDIISQTQKGDHILEIGCLLGKSTHYLATLLKGKEVTLHCCDLWEASQASSHREYCEAFEKEYGKNLLEEFKKNINSFDFIKYYKISSTQVFKKLNNIKFKYIYIDGSHKYETVRLDIINSLANIREDGIIAGDDYFSQNSGVKKAVDEIFGDNVSFYGEHYKSWVFDVQKNKK